MRSIFVAIVLFLLIGLSACSSINSDAEKAANLKKQSQESIKNNDLDKAEQLYNESESIIEKYEDTDDHEEFYDKFLEYSAVNNENSK